MLLHTHHTFFYTFYLMCYIVTYADSHLHTCTYVCRIIHSDTTIKKEDAGRLLYKYILPLTLLQGFERVVQGLHVRGCWRPNRNFIFWPPLLMTVTLCLSCSLDAQPGPWGPLCWMLAFFIASYQHLLSTPNSIGDSEGPLGRVWLSLPHLVSSCLEFYWQLLFGLELNWVK